MFGHLYQTCHIALGIFVTRNHIKMNIKHFNVMNLISQVNLLIQKL